MNSAFPHMPPDLNVMSGSREDRTASTPSLSGAFWIRSSFALSISTGDTVTMSQFPRTDRSFIPRCTPSRERIPLPRSSLIRSMEARMSTSTDTIEGGESDGSSGHPLPDGSSSHDDMENCGPPSRSRFQATAGTEMDALSVEDISSERRAWKSLSFPKIGPFSGTSPSTSMTAPGFSGPLRRSSASAAALGDGLEPGRSRKRMVSEG